MKVGASVEIVTNDSRPSTVWRIASEPWQLPSGEWVVLLEGFKGEVLVRSLREVGCE